jgi:hypothetical protein
MCNKLFKDVCSFCGAYLNALKRSPTPHVCNSCYTQLADPSLPFDGKEAINLAKKWYERVKGYEAMHVQDRVLINKLRKENWKLKNKLRNSEKKEEKQRIKSNAMTEC